MPEGSLGLLVGLVPRVVVVVGGVDDIRIYSVDESNLFLMEMRSVYSEGVDSHRPESNGVEGSFNKDNSSSSLWSVVEEEASDIDSCGIEVLGSSLSIQWSPNHTKHLSGWVSQRVGDCVPLRVEPESEVMSSSNTHALHPIGMHVTGIPSIQP